MACNLKPVQGIKSARDCKCYPAVLRTYKSMSDEPEHVAFDAALRVYTFHHPEDEKTKARLTVESWIYAENLH